jgi:hypothetical protein
MGARVKKAPHLYCTPRVKTELLLQIALYIYYWESYQVVSEESEDDKGEY